MDEPSTADAEGEARYRHLLRTSPAPINLFDESGTTVWGNDAVVDLLGLDSREALVGRSIFDFIHPDHHELARAELNAVIGAKEPVGPTPMWLMRADGEVLSIRVSTAPGVYRGDDIGQAIVIDDTPLMETQAELEAQRDLIERVIDTLPDLYVMLSPEGALLDWNEQLPAVTGYGADELEAMTVDELFSEADADRILGSVSTALESGHDIVEAELITSDGRQLPYEFHGGRLPNGEPGADRIVGIARDVAGREECDRHLRVVDRLLRHNLRNKLTVVMGYAELARDEDVALRKAHLDRVLGTCRQLLETMATEREIVNLIVEPGDPRRLDLRAVVDEEVAALRDAFPAADVSVAGPDAVDVLGVPNLRDAVAEVLDNAARHNPAPEPSVEVKLVAADAVVRLEVGDDGPPIPSSEARVFEAMTEEPLEHSEGLGLWFVHWALDRSGGRFEIERTPEGNTVALVLPRPDADGPTPDR